jgi:hypothetical protein
MNALIWNYLYVINQKIRIIYYFINFTMISFLIIKLNREFNIIFLQTFILKYLNG